MKKTYDDLQNKFQEVSADLYKQASASAGAAPGPEAGGRPGPEAEPQTEGPRKDHGDVVDAEFEVVDEDKKK
jgi:molecular chaperone DnaK